MQLQSLSPLEEIEMKKIHQELKKFDSVSKKIQSESINLFQVRTLFEEILSRHSMLGQYLGLKIIRSVYVQSSKMQLQSLSKKMAKLTSEL